MKHSYADDLMWNSGLIETATADIDRLQLNLARMEVAPTDSVIQEIIDALSSNIDTPRAIAALNGWMKDTESGVTGGVAGELGRALDTLLGITL
jgi:L-cysteine:1D-myo-inositol 2-amino-2-deoxy-alpha-D-glucopyranoside ligase